jgi:hypothetical protein
MCGAERLVAAALSLHADLVASEVVRSLHGIEVDPILLRGPAIRPVGGFARQ